MRNGGTSRGTVTDRLGQVVEKFIRPVRTPNGDDSARNLDFRNEKGRSGRRTVGNWRSNRVRHAVGDEI